MLNKQALHCVGIENVFCFLISKSTKKYRNHIKHLKGWCHPAAPALTAFVIVITKYIFLFTYIQELCHNSLPHKHSHNNNTVYDSVSVTSLNVQWLTDPNLAPRVLVLNCVNKKEKKSPHLEQKEFNTQREAGVLNRLLVFVDFFSLCSFDVQEHQSHFYTWTTNQVRIFSIVVVSFMQHGAGSCSLRGCSPCSLERAGGRMWRSLTASRELAD